MQPEGIISGDFSTESVFSQLCLQESELLSCNISGICVSGTECFRVFSSFSLAAIAAERRFPASVRLFSFSFCCALSVFLYAVISLSLFSISLWVGESSTHSFLPQMVLFPKELHAGVDNLADRLRVREEGGNIRPVCPPAATYLRVPCIPFLPERIQRLQRAFFRGCAVNLFQVTVTAL